MTKIVGKMKILLCLIFALLIAASIGMFAGAFPRQAPARAWSATEMRDALQQSIEYHPQNGTVTFHCKTLGTEVGSIPDQWDVGVVQGLVPGSESMMRTIGKKEYPIVGGFDKDKVFTIPVRGLTDAWDAQMLYGAFSSTRYAYDPSLPLTFVVAVRYTRAGSVIGYICIATVNLGNLGEEENWVTDTSNTHAIVKNFTNITTDTVATYCGATLNMTLKPNAYFLMPSSVTVKLGETTYTRGVSYTASTGKLSISGLTGTQPLTITAKADLAPLSSAAVTGGFTATYNGTPRTLTASGTHGLSGGAYSYQWYKNNTAISGATKSTYSVVNASDSGAYTCQVTYTYAGSSATKRTAAANVSIQKATQTLAFSSGTSMTYGQSYTARAAGGGGTAAVTYAVIAGGTGAATINQTTGALNVTKAGTIKIRATKTEAATSNYTTATKDHTVTVSPASQSPVSINSGTATTYGVTTYQFKATGGSGGGAVTYQIQSNSTAAGSINANGLLTITRAGTLYVKATKAADSNYTAVSSNVFALTINKSAQTGLSVSLTDGDAIVGNTGTMTASGGQGGAVTYTSSNQNIASVNQTTGAVTFKAAGSVTITATKAANDNYLAASATTTFNVTAAVAKIGNVYYNTLDDAFTAAVSGNTITLLSNATLAGTHTLNDKTLMLEGDGYTVTVAAGGRLELSATAASVFTVRNVTFTGGAVWQTSSDGGLAVNNGIKRITPLFSTGSNSKLTLTGVTVSHFDTGFNVPPGNLRGVLMTAGTTVVTDCTFTANGGGFGGAIAAQGGSLTIDGSTITGNQALYGGGICIVALQPVDVTIKDSTITGNRVMDNGFGEAIYIMSGKANCTLENTTVEGTVFLGYSASVFAKLTVNGAAMASTVIIHVDQAAVDAYTAALEAAGEGVSVDTFVLVESGDDLMTADALKAKVLVKNAGFSSKAMNNPEANHIVLVSTTQYAAAVKVAADGGDGIDNVKYFFSVKDAVDYAVTNSSDAVYLVDSYNESSSTWANGMTVRLSEIVTIPKGTTLTFKAAQRHVASDDTTITLKPLGADTRITLKRTVALKDEMIRVDGALTLDNVTLDGGAIWTNGIVTDTIKATGTSPTAVTSLNTVYANAPIIRNYGSLTLKSGTVLQNNENRYDTTRFGSQNYGGGIANLDGATLDMQAGSVIKDCYAREGGGIQNVNRAQAAGNSVTVKGTITGCVSQTKGAAVETIYGAKKVDGTVINGSLTTIAEGAKIEGNVSLCNLGVLTVEEGGKLIVSGDATTSVKAVNTTAFPSQYSICIYNRYGESDIVETVPDNPATKPYVEGVQAAIVEMKGSPVVTGELYLDNDCTAVTTNTEYHPYFELTDYNGGKLAVAILSTKGVDTYIAKGATATTLEIVDVRVIPVKINAISSVYAFSPVAGEIKVGGYEITVVQEGLDRFVIDGTSLGLKAGEKVTVNGQEFTVGEDGTFGGVMKLKQVTFPAPNGGMKEYDADGTITVGDDNYTTFTVGYTPDGGVLTTADPVRYGVLTMDDNYNVYAPKGTTYLGTDGTITYQKPLTSALLPNDVMIDEDGMMTFYIEGNKQTIVKINERDTHEPGGGKLTGASSTSLTITTETGVQYMLADADGNPIAWQDADGNAVTDWVDGADGTEYTFHGLTAGTKYQILKRKKAGPTTGPGVIIVSPIGGISTLPAPETGGTSDSEDLLKEFFDAYKQVEPNLTKENFGNLIAGDPALNALDAVFTEYDKLHPTLKEIVKDEYNRLAIAQKALDLKAVYDTYDADNYLVEDYEKLTRIYEEGLTKLYTSTDDADRTATYDRAVADMAAVKTKSASEDEYVEELEEFKKTGEAGNPDEQPGDSDEVKNIIDEAIDKIRNPKPGEELTTREEIDQLITETKVKADKQRAEELLDDKHNEILTDIPTYGELTDEGKKAIKDLLDEIKTGIKDPSVTTKTQIDELVEQGFIDLDREYAKQQINKDRETDDSDEVKSIIDAAFAEIDKTTDPSQLPAIVKKAQLDAEKQRAKDELGKKYDEIKATDDYKNAYTKDEKEAIDKAHKDAIDAIDAVTEADDFYTEIETAVKDGIFKLAYEDAIAELNAYRESTDSAHVSDIIDAEIERLQKGVVAVPPSITTPEDIRALVDDAKDAVDLQRIKDQKIAELEEFFSELRHSGKYDDEGLDELHQIFNGKDITPATGAVGNILAAQNVADVEAAFEKGKEDLLKVDVASIGTGGLKPGNDEDNFDYDEGHTGEDLAGKVDSSDKLSSDIELVIKKDSATEKDKVAEAIKNGSVKAADGNALTAQEAATLLRDRDFKAAFDIRLIYKETGVDVPTADLTGKFTISILLPQSMRHMQKLQVVFIADNGEIEVFETERVGNYLVFTTTHFSSYYMLGEVEVNLWWLIILLIVIIVLEIVFILLWHLVFAKRLDGNGNDADGNDADSEDTQDTAPNGTQDARAIDAQTDSGEDGADMAQTDTTGGAKAGGKSPVKLQSVSPLVLLGAILIPAGAIPTIIILGLIVIALAAYIVYMILRTLRGQKAQEETSEEVEAVQEPVLQEAEEDVEEEAAVAIDEPISDAMMIAVAKRARITRQDVLDRVEEMGETPKIYPVTPFTKERKTDRACDSFRIGEDWSFGVMYESKSEVLKLIMRLDHEDADALKQTHPQVFETEFGGGKEWYKIIVDETFQDKREVYNILHRAYFYVLRTRYTYDETTQSYTSLGADATEEELVDQIEEASRKKDEDLVNTEKKLARIDAVTIANLTFKPTKKEVAAAVRERFGAEVNTAERDAATRTGLPLADTYYHVHGITDKGETREVCFAYVYELKDGSMKLIAKLDKFYAENLMENYPGLSRSKFPKGKGWYVFRIDESFNSMNKVLAVLEQSKEFIAQTDHRD